MTHSELAKNYFNSGYNCSQSVLLAFSDLTGLEAETAARLASSFGGGLARMREVCGAVSGGAMVLGLLCGYSDPEDHAAKKAHYALVRDFAERFRSANGSIICRSLLEGTGATEGGSPEKRTEEYYRKRPCAELCACAADILDEIFTENHFYS